MNENLIYTQNYYNLYRVVEEVDFVQLLNESELPALIKPSLENLVNELYLQITGSKMIASPFYDLIVDGNQIDLIANGFLLKAKGYERITNLKVTSKFYTNSFEKLYKRIFLKDGSNEEEHVLESHFFSWLQDNLAKLLVKDERFEKYELTLKLLTYTELLFYFFNTFSDQINPKWIVEQSANWCKVSIDKRNVFSTFDKAYFKNYEEQLSSIDDSSPWKYVVDATRFSSYVMFNDEYAAKNFILFKNNMSIWISFWDNLQLPVLQEAVFHYLKDPRDFLVIAKELVSHADTVKTSVTHLSLILLKNLFECSLKTSENLLFYNNKERIESLLDHERHDALIAAGIKKNASWDQEKETLYAEVIKTILEVVKVEDLSEWIFAYQPRTSNRVEHDTLYNTEIEKLVSVFHENLLEVSFDEQIQTTNSVFNLQKFIFLSSQVNKNVNEKYAEDILKKLFEYINSEKFYWDETFSPTYWPSLKAIGLLISLLPEPSISGEKYIKKFRINHEGWNLSSNDYKLMHKESFVFCGAILLLEHDESFKDSTQRTNYFNYILHVIIEQTRFTVIKNTSDYKVPLYLLYLIVNQIYPDLKEHYEIEIIDNVDNINSVIEILSNDNYALSTSASVKLKQRLELEFSFEKKKYLQRGQANEIRKLEDAIEKLKL